MRNITRRVKISQAEDKDWRTQLYTYLEAYRNTPHATTGETPAKLFLGRAPRTKLPSFQIYNDDDQLRDRDRMNKQLEKERADEHRGARPSDVPGVSDNPLQEMSRNRRYRRACRVACPLKM